MNQHLIDAKEGLQLSAGTAGVTFPVWNEWVVWASGANQFLVAFMGLIVLGMTIYSLFLKIRLQHRQSRNKQD